MTCEDIEELSRSVRFLLLPASTERTRGKAVLDRSQAHGGSLREAIASVPQDNLTVGACRCQLEQIQLDNCF